MRRSFLRSAAVGTTFLAGVATSLRTGAQPASPPTGASAGPPPAATRVVVQVSDGEPARWVMVLNNVRNLQAELGADRVEVEIVAYGPGIGMLKSDSSSSAALAEAMRHGVAVQACQNTMRNQHLADADMLPGVSYVPAGIVQIVRRQQDGWIYVRP